MAEPEDLVLTTLKHLRRELSEVRTVCLSTLEHTRRVERRVGEVERRIDELRDDLESMLKAELMGRLGNFENAIEAKLEEALEQASRGRPLG